MAIGTLAAADRRRGRPRARRGALPGLAQVRAQPRRDRGRADPPRSSIGAALFAPYVAPHEPARQSLIRRFTPPVWAAGRQGRRYLLGTDQVGRDILSRMIHGARVSLMVGVAAVLVSLRWASPWG